MNVEGLSKQFLEKYKVANVEPKKELLAAPITFERFNLMHITKSDLEDMFDDPKKFRGFLDSIPEKLKKAIEKYDLDWINV